MIEFDDAEPADDGFDEDLPQRPDSRWTMSSPARRTLKIAAALLAVGGIFIYAVHSGSDQRRQADPAPSTSSAPPAPPSGTSADGGLLVEHLGDRDGTQRNDVVVTLPARLVPPACPQSSDGFASCVVASTLPTKFVRAVGGRFPKVEGGIASTATLRATDPGSRPGLWSRLYRAHVAGGGTLTILITRNESDADIDPLSINIGADFVTYLRHVNGPYRVDVQVRGPAGHSLPGNGLKALAADPRLVAS